VQKAKLLKQKKEEGNTAFKNSQLEEAYKLYRLISQNEETINQSCCYWIQKLLPVPDYHIRECYGPDLDPV
jgi:hypothetical protein